jgi:WD40 repeat protein
MVAGVSTRRRRGAIVAFSILSCGGVVAALTWSVAHFHGLTARTKHARPVTSVAFSRDGTRLLSVSREDEQFLVWDTENPLDRKYGARTSGRARVAALAPTGDVVVVDRDGVHEPFIVDLATGADTETKWSLVPFNLAFSPDGRCVAFTWSKCIGISPTPPINQKHGYATKTEHLSLAFSPDARTLVAGGEQELMFFIKDGGTITEAYSTAPAFSFRAIGWSPDGLTIFGGGGGVLVAWDVKASAPRWTIPAPVDQLAATRDGRFVVTLSQGLLQAFDAAKGRPVGKPLGGVGAPQTCFALSPEGELAAIGRADGTVEILDADALLASLR